MMWHLAIHRRLLLALGCLLAAGPTLATGRDCGVARQAVTRFTQEAPAIVCEVAHRHLLIVGDVHGTNEIPAFVEQLLRHASATRPVRLGIEFIGGMQPALSTYVRSKGAPADREALFGMGYWASPDGRTSEAMKRLIDRVRMLRAEGRDVDVFTMKPDYPGDAAIARAGGMEAFVDRGMASAVREQVRHGGPAPLVIAFMGNAHADMAPAAPGGGRSVTARLADLQPYLLVLSVHGRSWSCGSPGGCGVHRVDSAGRGAGDGAKLRVLAPIHGVHRMAVDMPTATASPPVLAPRRVARKPGSPR